MGFRERSGRPGVLHVESDVNQAPEPTALLDRLADDAVALRRLAHTLARDEHTADDLVQELAIRSLQVGGAPIRRPGAWLRSVLRNLARDRLRSRSRRKQRERAAASPEAQLATIDVVQRAESSRRLLREVLALPEPRRGVVLARYFDNLTPTQIAEMTGVPASTVRTRLHRGLQQLRRRLAGADAGHMSTLLHPLLVAPHETARRARFGPGLGGTVMSTSANNGMWWVACLVLLLLVGTGVVTWFERSPAPGGNGLAELSETQLDPVAGPDLAAAPMAAVADAQAEPPSEARPAGEAPEAQQAPAKRMLPATVLRHTPRQPERRRLLPVVAPTNRPDAKEADGVAPTGLATSTELPISKWDLIAPFGTVTLSGRVIDENGNPIPHATLLLVPVGEDEAAQRIGRYTFFHRVGKAAEDGRFMLTEQPSGKYLLAADYHAAMRDEGDLDTGSALRVSARPGASLRALTIQLPLALDRLGSARACIVDENGEAVAGSTVELVGHGSAYSDRHGCWVFGAVSPGRYTVRSKPYGYTLGEVTIDVRAGERTAAKVVVSRVNKGAGVVSGFVSLRDRSPVQGARVYLGNEEGISYSTLTTQAGAFRFEGLPELLERQPFHVHVHPAGMGESHTSAARRDLTLPTTQLALVVDRRVPVTVYVREEGSGDSVVPHAISSLHLGGGQDTASGTPFPTKTLKRPGDPLILHLPTGRNILTVNAPGRRGVKVEITVPDDDTALATEVRLPTR